MSGIIAGDSGSRMQAAIAAAASTTQAAAMINMELSMELVAARSLELVATGLGRRSS